MNLRKVFFQKTIIIQICALLFALSAKATGIGIGQPQEPVQATPGCVSAADMTAIANGFPQFQKLAGKEYCFTESQESYLVAGLAYILKIQFTQPMVNSPDELFTGKFANDWFGYFNKRINKVSIEAQCQVGVVAYVMSFFHNNTMHVCPMALTSAFTPMDLASVFLHEARHIDGFPHTTCSEGPRANLQGACDKKISDGGSYAVTVETYSQLGQYGKDINPAFRAIAKASALIYGAEAFVTPVKINTEEAFLALTADKKLYQIDAELKNQPVLMGETAESGHLMKSKLGLTIMPDDKTKPIVRIFPTGETQSLTLEYNNGTAADRSQVVDYYFGWIWNAKVEKTKITFFCDKRQNPTAASVVNIPSGEAIGIVYPEGYTPDRAMAYLKTTQGLVQFGCQNNKGTIANASLKIDSNLKRIHKAKNTFVGLTAEGEIVKLSGSTSSRIPAQLESTLGLSQVTDITSYSRATFFDAK